MKSSGIYVIFNKINWKLYIGSTCNLGVREQQHFSNLQKGIHHCKHLQSSFNKHGKDAFEFHVVENMLGSTKEERLKREEEWIAIHWGKGKCYNGRKDAISSEGILKKSMTKETKQKIRENHPKARYITAWGITKNLREWALTLGCSVGMICNRLNAGWTEEMAITIPIQKRKDRHENTTSFICLP